MKIELSHTDARVRNLDNPCSGRLILPTDARNNLERKYDSLISVNPRLTRGMVSFQANKQSPFYNWFKYKEGFSQDLVKYLLTELAGKKGKLLDPFAGVGTSQFAAQSLGWQTAGIELLPVGFFVRQARVAGIRIGVRKFGIAVNKVLQGAWKAYEGNARTFRHIAITEGAFPTETENQLNSYMTYCQTGIADKDIRVLLFFAAYAILESVSYTRKDGQYLRWDMRSGRRNGKSRFLKSSILPFEQAIGEQLLRMLSDVKDQSLTPSGRTRLGDSGEGRVDRSRWIEGSALKELCFLRGSQFNFILTSPPYCNRYDYTRTYALELVFLGCSDEAIKQLRQEMLSCTVENREKREYLRAFYRTQGRRVLFEEAVRAFEQQEALGEILEVLEKLRTAGRLNNNGVSRMVRNYFLEMSLVIFECARLMKKGARFAMVNDNVQYAGEIIPVDLILSEIAIAAGLEVEHIWTLCRGKGNSSQQMGEHGRNELRKCVYIWRKPRG